MQIRISSCLQTRRNQASQRFRTRRKIRLATTKLVNRTEKSGVRSQLKNLAHRVHAASKDATHSLMAAMAATHSIALPCC